MDTIDKKKIVDYLEKEVGELYRLEEEGDKRFLSLYIYRGEGYRILLTMIEEGQFDDE